MNPTPYRVVDAQIAGQGLRLVISEDGLEDPDVDIVLVWRDEQDREWAHWKDQDYRVDALSWRFPLDSSDGDTQVLIGNNKVWSSK